MGQTHPIRTKTAFVPNLVKPPEAPNSRQPADSVAEINLKIWRVYPLESASLKVEIKFGASFPACAFSFATTLIPALTTNAQSQGRFTPTHSSVAGELCPQGGPGTRPRHHSPRRSWRSGLRPQSHEPRLRGRQALRTNASLRLHGRRRQQALARAGKNQHLHADGRYQLCVQRITHRRTVAYKKSELDFVVAYLMPVKTWYILPISVVAGRRSFLLAPPGFRGKNSWAEYLEAWHLLGKPHSPAEPMYRGHSQPRKPRKNAAHGASRGKAGKTTSPGKAKD
jgi:hypothetical protein